MTIQQIFDLAIKLGTKNDLRGEKRIKEILAKTKEKYEKMSAKEKECFDSDKLTNPFSDSRVLYLPKDKNKKIKKVLVGIDMEGPELLLAKQMEDIDLVIAHHPEGYGLADLSGVMNLQAEVLAQYGVPINVAENVLREKISEVARGISPINHYRAVDIAKLLDIGFICVHTPADNMVATFLKNQIDKKKCIYVSEVMDILRAIPEYHEAQKMGFGPCLFAGNEDNFCGKITVTEITGGTEGSPKIYEKMSQAGIGTIIGMHMSEKHKEEAGNAHINAIIAGHISSDSIGINLFLDELEKAGIEIIPASGLIRISRNKKIKK